MLAKLSRTGAAPILLLALLFSLVTIVPSSADAASSGKSYSSVNRGHVTHKNQRNRSIKPYKYERNIRYPYASNHRPISAPCSVIGANPAKWPKGIVSCY